MFGPRKGSAYNRESTKKMNEKNEAENVLSFLPPHNHEGPPKQRAMDAVMVLREAHPEADLDVGRAVIAFDRRDHTMKLDLCKKETMDYLVRSLQTVAHHPDLYGVGTDVLGHFDLAKSKHWTAEVLGLERADDAMTNALLAALLGTIATSPSPVHLDTALFGIGAFVHAHPRFAKILGHRRYQPPFEENTEYTVCSI